MRSRANLTRQMQLETKLSGAAESLFFLDSQISKVAVRKRFVFGQTRQTCAGIPSGLERGFVCLRRLKVFLLGPARIQKICMKPLG